jgi:hypothetical protein
MLKVKDQRVPEMFREICDAYNNAVIAGGMWLLALTVAVIVMGVR